MIKAFSLAIPHEEALKIKEEVGLFQAIKSTLTKTIKIKKQPDDQFDGAIKQIISKAVISDRIIDIFEAAGIRKPQELTEMIRKSVTIDWTQRESVEAEMRLKVKKILREYGYPPDKEKSATETVLKQAELVAKGWAES